MLKLIVFHDSSCMFVNEVHGNYCTHLKLEETWTSSQVLYTIKVICPLSTSPMYKVTKSDSAATSQTFFLLPPGWAITSVSADVIVIP
jgi:hypothetical protein